MRKSLYLLSAISSVSAFAVNEEVPQLPKNELKYSVDGSFTYWYAKEDGLNVGESAQVDAIGSTLFASNPEIFQQSFGYKPGFKVGIGLESGTDFGVHGEYTYYRGETTASRNAPTASSGIGVWNVDSWFLQSTPITNQSLVGTHLSSTWKIAMDMGDLILYRPFKEDQGFSFSPFGGLRTVWIRQNLDIGLTQAAAAVGGSRFLGPQPLASNNSSHMWGIGPHVGVGGRYNLPFGLNVEGMFGATLFYTKFTQVKHSEAAATVFYQTLAPINMSYNCVRPEVDVNLGIGWGRDLYQNSRFDLSASYDFSYFWSQNMMRPVLDEYWAGTSSGSTDLYFQGLTLTVAFAF